MTENAAEMATLKAELQSMKAQLGGIAADMRLLLGIQSDFVRMNERQMQHNEKMDRAFDAIQKHRKHLEDFEEDTGQKFEEVEKKHHALEAEFRKWLYIGVGVWVTASVLWTLFGKWLTESIHVSVR